MRVVRSRRGYSHRFLTFRDRNYDFAGMQVQARFAEARTIAVNIVADDRPALGGRVHTQLMGAAGERFHRKPAHAVAAAEHLPFCDSDLALGVGLLPPA